MCSSSRSRSSPPVVHPSSEPWTPLAADLRASPAPYRDPAYAALHALALAEGVAALRGFRALDAARREDLARDLLAAKLPEIVAADHPRRFFRAALFNAAKSWLRRRDAAVAGGDADPDARGTADRGDDREVFLIHARRVLAALSPRDRAVVVAIAEGADRDAIARAHNTSRDNVDQILCRARQRFHDEGLASCAA